MCEHLWMLGDRFKGFAVSVRQTFICLKVSIVKNLNYDSQSYST